MIFLSTAASLSGTAGSRGSWKGPFPQLSRQLLKVRGGVSSRPQIINCVCGPGLNPLPRDLGKQSESPGKPRQKGLLKEFGKINITSTLTIFAIFEEAIRWHYVHARCCVTIAGPRLSPHPGTLCPSITDSRSLRFQPLATTTRPSVF